jgi:hypothetical protein
MHTVTWTTGRNRLVVHHEYQFDSISDAQSFAMLLKRASINGMEIFDIEVDA